MLGPSVKSWALPDPPCIGMSHLLASLVAMEGDSSRLADQMAPFVGAHATSSVEGWRKIVVEARRLLLTQSVSAQIGSKSHFVRRTDELHQARTATRRDSSLPG
jgi:hypothetical protein